MIKEDFLKITEYIGGIIKGTSFEGHVFAVGGSVRDLHMGNDIKDIDLVIDLPHGGVDFANWCKDQGYTKTVVIYETYGTAMFKFKQFPGEEIECVMTRGEKYEDPESRNPVTVFAPLEEDAIRRDLTINALYYNISTGETLDLVGGLDDIANHIIRTTNQDPDVVFDDDPLRILRVVRFATRYGWEIERKTYKSMKKHARRLKIITKERIQTELNKILMSKRAIMGIDYMHKLGVMEYVIPEFEKCYGLTQNRYHFGDVAAHTMAVLEHHCTLFEPNLVERLACLLHDIGKVATRTVKDGKVHFYDHEYVGADMAGSILRDLKYDNDTIKEVQFLIRNHMRTKQAGDGGKYIKDKTLNKMLYECKTFERFKSLMRIIECDNLSHAHDCCIYNQYCGLVDKVCNSEDHMRMFGYKLPVDGNEIMETLDIPAGPLIAEINKRLLNQAFLDPGISKGRCINLLPKIKKEAEQYLNK